LDVPRTAALTAPSGDRDLAVRADEFALLAAAHRRARLPPLLGVVPFLSGVAVAAALFSIGEALAWPESAAPACVAAGAAVIVAVAVLLWRAERRRLLPFAFACPACGAPILGTTFGARDVRRAELVNATGRCPECGATVTAHAAERRVALDEYLGEGSAASRFIASGAHRAPTARK
jgi:predicted RNA-binding Zn-ribbon protein involved in translation (DUF1610 family)